LDDPARKILPEFSNNTKDSQTLRHPFSLDRTLLCGEFPTAKAWKQNLHGPEKAFTANWARAHLCFG